MCSINCLPPIIPSIQVFGGRLSWDPEEGERVLQSFDCPQLLCPCVHPYCVQSQAGPEAASATNLTLFNAIAWEALLKALLQWLEQCFWHISPASTKIRLLSILFLPCRFGECSFWSLAESHEHGPPPLTSHTSRMPQAFAYSESFCQALYKRGIFPFGADGGFDHENMFHQWEQPEEIRQKDQFP